MLTNKSRPGLPRLKFLLTHVRNEGGGGSLSTLACDIYSNACTNIYFKMHNSALFENFKEKEKAK